jgi:cystathionine gamma-synthase
MRKETLAIHATNLEDKTAASIASPIFLSTTFERHEDGSYPLGHMYSRNSNPNRDALEKGLAMLEGGAGALAFSSGLAAVNAVFQCLSSGDHVLMPLVGYYASYKLAEEILGPWGLEVSQTNMSDLNSIESAIKENTKLIWLESPANPQLTLTDIEAVCKLAHSKGIKVAVDNTLASPILQNPIAFGADFVMHATTKYIGGHSDVLGGAIVYKTIDSWSERMKRVQILMGSTPNPLDCYLLARGLKTLAIRMKQHSENALELAKRLQNHPKILAVHYPGLTNNPQYDLAIKQMPLGQSGMIAVQMNLSEEETQLLASQLGIFKQATSLGGVESLVEHRRSIEGPSSTTPGNLLRLSVGLENIEDLWEAWRNI